MLTFCVFLFTAICSFRVINNKYAEYKVTPVPTKPPIKSPYVPKTSFSILDQVNILLKSRPHRKSMATTTLMRIDHFLILLILSDSFKILSLEVTLSFSVTSIILFAICVSFQYSHFRQNLHKSDIQDNLPPYIYCFANVIAVNCRNLYFLP